jgi:hypothetical protein
VQLIHLNVSQLEVADVTPLSKHNDFYRCMFSFEVRAKTLRLRTFGCTSEHYFWTLSRFHFLKVVQLHLLGSSLESSPQILSDALRAETWFLLLTSLERIHSSLLAFYLSQNDCIKLVIHSVREPILTARNLSLSEGVYPGDNNRLKSDIYDVYNPYISLSNLVWNSTLGNHDMVITGSMEQEMSFNSPQ